jgi:excisionase family DNA binding protein
MHQQILITCSLDDIEAIIVKNVNKALEAHGLTPTAIGTNDENQFLTKEEAAKILKVSVGSLDNWDKSGVLKASRIGSMVRYKRADIEQALKTKGR